MASSSRNRVQLKLILGMKMKSAYELAMERMGGSDQSLSDEQKKAISEIDAKYKAKIAEKKIFLEKSISEAMQSGAEETVQKLHVSQSFGMVVYKTSCWRKSKDENWYIISREQGRTRKRDGRPALNFSFTNKIPFFCIENLDVKIEIYLIEYSSFNFDTFWELSILWRCK